MKVHFLRAAFAALLLTSFSALAQMHRVAKPEQVVRAIGVYEWTGDLSKPKASRLIPVSIFINGRLEDAGVYVARPVPFALLTGNVYELQSAGIDKAILDLAYARHLQAVDSTGDTAWDDGWFGYGSVKPLAIPKKPVLKASKGPLPAITTSRGSASSAGSGHPQLQPKTSGDASSTNAGQSKTSSDTGSGNTSNSDPDRPTMKRRSDGSGTSDSATTSGSSTAGSGSTTTASTNNSTTDARTVKSSGSTSSDDPDRPTMKRRSDSTDDSTTTSSTSTSGTPADDPDRPTMKRRSDRSGTNDSTSTSSASSTTAGPAKDSGNTPADDPDRPTMKRRSSDNTADSTTTASTTGDTPANDPDRPTLKRHAPEDAKKKGNSDSASVSGIGSLNDDPNRPMLHRGKPTSAMTETDLPKLTGLPEDLHQMVAVSDAVDREPHEFALAWENDAQRSEVLEKVRTLARAQLSAYAGKSAPAAPVPAPKTAAKTRRTAPPPIAAPEPLLDEELKGYTLSYGGAATYVYTAHTSGTGSALRYVTIVVQADGLGELKPAIQSVTDAMHLDRTPRMRFVDVVDAEASNRASLLFELRSQSSRQFGLYRVIAARSEQTFLTGTTQ